MLGFSSMDRRCPKSEHSRARNARIRGERAGAGGGISPQGLQQLPPPAPCFGTTGALPEESRLLSNFFGAPAPSAPPLYRGAAPPRTTPRALRTARKNRFSTAEA